MATATRPTAVLMRWYQRTEKLMNFFHVIATILITSTLARIIEQRDPKIDPLTLDNILSQIVENTMGDMRFRLRQAIYGMALKKLPRCSHPDCGPVDNYEEFLLDHFISQISGTVENVDNGSQSTVRGHRSERPVAKAREVVRLQEPLSNNNHQESHKMAIALETYTTGPVKKHSGKLITADDFRMFDSPAASNENSPEEPRPLLFRLPLWQLLLVIIPSSIILLLIAFALIICFRQRRRRTRSLKRRSKLFTIPGSHTLPDFTNTPQSFLERLSSQQPVGTIVREREHCEVWTRPPTATTSLESLQRP